MISPEPTIRKSSATENEHGRKENSPSMTGPFRQAQGGRSFERSFNMLEMGKEGPTILSSEISKWKDQHHAPTDTVNSLTADALDHSATAAVAVPAAELLQTTFSALAASTSAAQFNDSDNPLATWRKNFVNDVSDPGWGTMAQGQTESYLANQLPPEIALISVKCASSFCEIQAASSSAANSEYAANAWIAQMSAMSNESWWTTFGFAAPNSAILSAPDGRALIVSYLTRSFE